MINKVNDSKNKENNSELSNNIVNKDDEHIEERKNNNIDKSKELKNKNNKRSQSQGPIDPLKKEENSEKKEIKEKEINKNKNETPKKVIKIIRDLLPYTHVGFDGEEPKENNQDNYFIFKNFAEHKDYIYMSVCDGHGVEGHFVSEFIKEVLPYYMSENLKERNILTERDLTHKIIKETFVIVNNMLVDNESINSLFSGSTCVSVIFTPERLIVPNIGDSRAVLGRFDKTTGKYKAIELSRDHKPTEKDEAKRIYENDGRIQPFTEDGEFVGPQRVWIKEEEVPGLAMTRSFGDRVAASVGVISEPEIKEFDFTEDDKYMIIASDGIWEFISSHECIDIIKSYYESNDLKGCCEYLYQESSKRWLKEEEVIDDTTLILVFFE
jgi:serine/threonine protein phosphatase PrpC